MPDKESANNYRSDELSLYEVLRGIKQSAMYLLRHWKIIALSCLLCISATYFSHKNQQERFTAKLTFMLNDDSGGQLSGITGILGQLGLPVPSGKYNIDHLLEISRSRSRIQETLFEIVEVGEQSGLLANHLIELYELDSQWATKDARFEGFRFKHSDLAEFNETENFALKSIYGLVAGSHDDRDDALLQVNYGREAYIMDFSMTSFSQDLSIQFVKVLFDKVSQFYISKAIEKPMNIFKSMAAKRDSIEKAWIEVETTIANRKDSNFGSFGSRAVSELNRLTSQAIILKTALAQAEQNLVIAELSLSNNTPLIQKIDDPIPPLQPNRTSLFRIALIGIGLGLFIAMVILVTREIVMIKL